MSTAPTPTDSLRLYRSLFENSPDGVILARPDGTALHANPAACRMLGRTEAEIQALGRSGLAVHDEAMRACIATRDRDGISRALLTYHRADGSTFPADVTTAVVPGPAGDTWAYVIFRDVSERQEGERRLQEARRALHEKELDLARLHGLEGRINEIELVMLPDGAILHANDRALEAYGYTRDELRRLSIRDLRAPSTQSVMPGQMAEALEQGIRFETEHQRKDGTQFPVRVSSRGFDVGGERYLHSLVQDLTEVRALEQERQVASRLAAIGTLVSGVAHEMNNPLAGQLASQSVAIEDAEELRTLLGTLDPARRTVAAERVEEILECLHSAQSAARRISQIVKDLGVLGRRDPRRHRVRMRDVVEEAVRALPATVAERAELRVQVADAPDVMASPGQLGQVIVNLVTNGAHSIPAGRRGTVTLSVGPGDPGRVRIEVSDDGEGVAADAMERIFDPFFTTRDVGKGIGLGLPVCHAIVTAHGGTIGVDSKMGEGATFRVELPAADEPTQGVPASWPAAPGRR